MTDSLQTLSTRCVIVGGGPAGMMAGYLFARAGIETIVLEKHMDFLRDFRGDTVHPSTTRIMAELGLLEEFLERPHQKVDILEGRFGKDKIRLGDLRKLDVPCPYIAFMPQWDFLNFLAEKSHGFPNLKIMMGAETTGLIQEKGRFTGVQVKTQNGTITIKSELILGCDGRHSITRQSAQLPVENTGAPIDVLWFRVSRKPSSQDHVFARLQPGRMLVTLDRGDYWQCAYVISKGGIEEIKQRGLDAFRKDVASVASDLNIDVEQIKSWDDIKLLTVAIDHLPRWSRSGLLCIGDAAHAMSPVGGVGINLAVQDAVAAANILVPKLIKGAVTEDDLDEVRRRRLFPARFIQMMQVQIQNHLLVPTIRNKDGKNFHPPFFMRIVDALPSLQRLTAYIIGVGIRSEHVRTASVKN